MNRNQQKKQQLRQRLPPPPTVPAPRLRKKAVRVKKGSKIGSNVGRFLGNAAGNMIPIPGAGRVLGGLAEWAGNKIGTVLGLGEYTLERNTITQPATQVPWMHSDSDDVIFRHRSYLGEVISAPNAGDYSVRYIPIQPGMEDFDPWGSGAFALYKEWIPQGILFQFESTTAEFSGVASPNTGIVMMGTDYNAFDTAPFPDKITLENNFGTTKAKPQQSFHHPVECAPKRNIQDAFFVRTGALPAGQPPQFYDLGTFAIASSGCPTANQKLGELWCVWEIRARRATMNAVGGSLVQMDAFKSATGNVANLLVNPTPSVSNSLGGTIQSSGSTYAFPPNLSFGTYRITVRILGTTATAIAAGIGFAITNAVFTTDGLSPGVPVQQTPSNGGTSLSWVCDGVIRITAPGAKVAFPQALGTTTMGGTTLATLIVQQWDFQVTVA